MFEDVISGVVCVTIYVSWETRITGVLVNFKYASVRFQFSTVGSHFSRFQIYKLGSISSRFEIREFSIVHTPGHDFIGVARQDIFAFLWADRLVKI